MAYYPKSQIKTNLFTEGGQLENKSTGEEYVGYYWQTSKNEYFTGRNPSDGVSIPLQIITTPPPIKVSLLTYTDNNKTYNKLKGVNISKTLKLPFYQKPTPTGDDYQIGSFRRFFCKKINENLYIETTKDIYNKIASKDKGYAFTLYQPFTLIWQISGNRKTVEQTNQRIVELTESQQKITGLGEYLNHNYIEFYQ
jgi:hypothetical protein